MTDMNKPVKITHDPETGDILSIENDCAVDDYCLHSSAEEIIDPIVAVGQKWDVEEDQAQIDDYWWDQRVSAELNHQKQIEADKAERSRRWMQEAYLEDHPSARSKATPPKPSQVHFKPSPEKIKEMSKAFKPIQENFKKIGKSAKKTTEALNKFPATGSVENRGTHLHHRPFHNLEMIVFRDSLEENQ